jgi:hypothetical protein
MTSRMDIVTALILLLLIGLAAWLLPIPGTVIGAAVFLVLVVALISLARGGASRNLRR